MIYPFFMDWTILLIIPGIIVAIWAQTKVSRAYKIYSKLPVSSGVSGSVAAAKILNHNGIKEVSVFMTRGVLSDNYNPRKKTVYLSEDNYNGHSIAAVAVAAHECGHAIQHHESYFPLRIRSLMAPIISASSYLLWPILILGMLAGMAQSLHIVVYIFVGIFVFQVVTLPVEYNASRRALAALEAENVLSDDELYGARKMLRAAALTYVAATLVALLNVLRFSMLSRRR